MFGIEFLAFSIRDFVNDKLIWEAKRPATTPQLPPDFDYDQLRTIDYKFPRSFLECKTIATKLKFRVGSKPVKNFTMVERHYFKGKLLKSWTFTVAFCMPNSENTWEAMYDMPTMDAKTVEELMKSPGQCKADSFYFVEGKLVMHNKAAYTFDEERG